MRVLQQHLDEEQLEIAQASDRSLLVIAGPGSGKTHLLAHTAAYRVRTSHPARWRVLCLTFSVEAARQMRTRLADAAMELPSQRRIEVANFHQLGMRLLGHHGHHVGWPRDAQIIDVIEAREIAKASAMEVGLPAVSGRDAFDAIQRLRNQRTVTDSIAPSERLQSLRATYERHTQRLRVRDFDDLILHTIRMLDEVPAVAEIVHQTYRYILVDELQDTSGWQMELVARIAGSDVTVFAVADNDQMIYEWRDARSENIDEWEGRFAAERVSLLGNYRCPQRIVGAANALLSARRASTDIDQMPYSRVSNRDGEIVVLQPANEFAEGRVIADQVALRLDYGVAPGEIAILASVGFLLNPAESGLAAADIDHVRVGDDPQASAPLARAFRAALVLAASPEEPRSQERFRRLLAAYVDRDSVADIEAELLGLPTAEAMLARLADSVLPPDDDEQLAHALEIITLARREYGAERPTYLGRRLAIDWHRLSRQLQRETEAVKVMTTFAAKGLEFDTVIIPGFNEGLVPYLRQSDRQTTQWWAEERRKLYVAVTRTKDRLVLSVRGDGRPSSFLADLEL